MHQTDDFELLRRYAEDGSEAAFTELVARYINLVHSTALRHLGRSDLAGEITQVVFVIMARKAKELNRRTVISGWLYHTTRLTAANALRSEMQRSKREQAAHMQTILNESQCDAWEQIRPLLDDMMAQLGEKDRDAIVLRFFEGRNMREIGYALGATEEAAKKRVNRALDKLRKLFIRRGVTVSAAAIAGVVSANAVQAAPPGLATAINAASASKALHVFASLATTSSVTTLQKSLLVSTFVILLGAGIYQGRQVARLRAQNQILQQRQAPLLEQLGELQRDGAKTTNSLAELTAQLARIKRDNFELLKLRNEVTQLRPLQVKVSRLEQLASQSSSGFPQWKPEEVQNVGRTTPVDALQTYLWSSRSTNRIEIANSLTGDEEDPPTVEAMREFVGDPGNHPFSNDGVSNLRVLSQTITSPDEVRLEVNAQFGPQGISVPLIFRNVDGVWKLVVFSLRDADGKTHQLQFMKEVLR